METKKKLELLCEAAASRKGEDIVILQMDKKFALCERFLLVSASSTVRVKAIVDQMEEAAQDHGLRILHKEGYDDGLWVLLDFGDVLAHVFHADTRKFYGLENLWGDVPKHKYAGVS